MRPLPSGSWEGSGDCGWVSPAALHALNLELFKPGAHYQRVDTPASELLETMRAAYAALPSMPLPADHHFLIHNH